MIASATNPFSPLQGMYILFRHLTCICKNSADLFVFDTYNPCSPLQGMYILFRHLACICKNSAELFVFDTYFFQEFNELRSILHICTN